MRIIKVVICVLLLSVFYSCQKNNTIENKVNEKYNEAYDIIKSKINSEKFNDINWEKGQVNIFESPNKLRYKSFIFQSKSNKNEFLFYSDLKEESELSWIEFRKDISSSSFSGEVLIRDDKYEMINKLTIANRKIVPTNFLSTNIIKNRSTGIMTGESEVIIPCYIPSSKYQFDFWNMGILLNTTSMYNNFISFEIVSDDNGSAGIGSPILTEWNPPPTTPCDAIKALSSDTSFVNKFNYLSGKLTQDYEEGYIISRNIDGAYMYSKVQGLPGQNGISFTSNGGMLGLIHSHYNGLNSMPSVEDLHSLGRAFEFFPREQRVSIASEYTLGVVSQYGAYIIKIENVEDFASFYVNKLQDSTDRAKFKKDEYIDNYNLDKEQYKDSWENEFLKMMSKFKTGLKLFKANDKTYSEWEDLVVNLNSNKPKKGNCAN